MVATHRMPAVRTRSARGARTAEILLYTLLVISTAFAVIVYGLLLADTGHSTLAPVVLLGGLGLEATVVAWIVAGKVP